MSRLHRTSAFLFVFLAALAAGVSIFAWVQMNLKDIGFPDRGLLLPGGTITFLLEQDGSSQINDGSELLAIRSSYARINGIATSDAEIIDGGQFDFPDPVDVSDGLNGSDGVNRIFFFAQDQDDLFGGGIAAAFFFFNPNTGVILDCDIAFSDIIGATWSADTPGNPGAPLPPGRIDVEGVANQEIMHCFGLEHSPIAGRFDASTGLQVDGFNNGGDFSLQSSLFPFAARTIETRTLEPDDIAAFSTVYQNAEAIATFGVISGQVFAPDGTTGVKGAHVVAVPADDPTLPVVGALSGLGSEPGGYRLTGLEPGDYFVRVEPLLGTTNIFTEEDTFFSGFETAFPPEFYSGAAESDTDEEISSGDAVRVTVTAGAEEPSIDVILNNVTPPPPNDDFANATVISQLPFTDSKGISTATTEDSDPTPSCANGSRAKSVWYGFVPSAGGTVRADTIGSDYDTILTVWTGDGAPSSEVACNDDIILGQEIQSELSFSATEGTPYYFMVTSYSGSGGNLVFHLGNASPPPPNDDFANATVISHLPFTDSKGISTATTEDSDPTPSCANGSRAKSVWYGFVPSAGGTVRADTIGSDYDTILTVWTGDGAPSSEVACNDDIILGQEIQSELSFSATEGTPYYFMVTSYSGSGGNLVFHLEEIAGADFSITASPSSITISAGGTAVYTLTLTPEGGFTGEVSLSCLGAPFAAACQASPSAVQLNGVDEDEGTATLTVTTTARSLLSGSGFPIRGIPWFLMVVFLVGLAEWGSREMPGRAVSRRGMGWGIATMLLLSTLWVSCDQSRGPTPSLGTPPGTYTLTITGTSGTIDGTIEKSTTVTLIVN